MSSLMKFVFRGVSAAHSPSVRSSASARRIRVVLFVISIGAHAVAVFCIAHLAWQLRKHQQQNRRNGRPRSLSPPKKSPLDVSDAQVQALVDRLQQPPTEDGTTAACSNDAEGTDQLDEQLLNTSQWDEQLQKMTTERDSLKSQVDALLEEKMALSRSKQQLEELLSQHETHAKENEGLRIETNQEKEINANLNKENEVLRNEVGRLTELVDQMKKAQEAFRSSTTRGLLAMPTMTTMTRTTSGKKLSSATPTSPTVEPPV